MACVGLCKNTCIIGYIIVSLAMLYLLYIRKQSGSRPGLSTPEKILFTVGSVVTLTCAIRWYTKTE